MRPHSLLLSIAPVLAGTALAWSERGAFEPLVALAVAAAALLIHIGCNLQNDVGGFRRGADRFERPGPLRATTLGWLAPRAVDHAVILSFALAGAVGVWLVHRGGWPIVATGVASIATAALYMAGPRPLAYGATSEALVVAFFGLVPAAGSYYLQSHTVSASAWQAGAVLGLSSAAVLALNNYRDVHADRRAGRRTLAVIRGERFCRVQYVALIASALVLVAVLAVTAGGWLALPLLLIPQALGLVRRVRSPQPKRALNALLLATIRFDFTLAVLLAAGALAQRMTA